MSTKLVNKTNGKLKGEIIIPADKSISHRAVMFSSLAKGVSKIENFSQGADCLSTLGVFKSLGVNAEFQDEKTLIINAKNGIIIPRNALDCGNSGTTMRLMSGILAGQKFNSVLTGDESLSKRPMGRVIKPLELMGAKITSNEGRAPLNIFGQELMGIDYVSELASAQVKSCVLLAGLHANGTTSFTEPHLSRNHTELMLEYLGAKIPNFSAISESKTIIEKSELTPKTITVAGDISSAAFFIVAGLIVPNSEIILKNVGLNPTRTGILEVVKNMGADIEILDKNIVSNELVGDLKIKYCELKGCTIEGDIIPRLIDELPVIAVLATQAQGTTIIKNAQDLRNKESDRIKAVVCELKKLGANIEETPDGFIIEGKTKLKGDVEVETYHDHRLAMSLYVAGLICENPISINGFEWVNISFPEFEKIFKKII
ncbi:MAG: 3-phosphoshikimate 1-carboxyvinyltransferase [bacterium]